MSRHIIIIVSCHFHIYLYRLIPVTTNPQTHGRIKVIQLKTRCKEKLLLKSLIKNNNSTKISNSYRYFVPNSNAKRQYLLPIFLLCTIQNLRSSVGINFKTGKLRAFVFTGTHSNFFNRPIISMYYVNDVC